MLKKYKLNYRLSPAVKFAKPSAVVPGHDIVLTSAPGVISSTDEFYAITGRHSRITVAGTDIRYEPRTSPRLDLSSLVFLPARVMAANRLATSARTWAKLMKRDPQGAQQWLLVDRKVLQSYNTFVVESRKQDELIEATVGDRQPSPGAAKEEDVAPPSLVERVAGLIWVVDNVPQRLHGEDVTADTMLGHGRSLQLDGTPHFQETLIESGLDSVAELGYLKQETAAHEEDRHSVRFYALASGGSEYEEGLTVMHRSSSSGGGGKGDVDNGHHNEENDAGHGRGRSVSGEADAVPASSMAGFSSKWTWA